jgi:hypothetical protein
MADEDSSSGPPTVASIDANLKKLVRLLMIPLINVVAVSVCAQEATMKSLLTKSSTLNEEMKEKWSTSGDSCRFTEALLAMNPARVRRRTCENSDRRCV